MIKSNINSLYRVHGSKRVSQGDLYRDLSFFSIGKNGEKYEVFFQYAIILSQECDLDHGYKILSQKKDGEELKFNQYLHSVLFAPAFPAEILRRGEHLKSLYNIVTDRINSSSYKIVKNNETPRYHFLPSWADLQVPELIVDFKAYYTLPFEYFYEICQDRCLASINELFREDVSQRFGNYLNRVGTPELTTYD
ncbi:hypothetical protein SAMN05660420_01840 [Desulfuromusa kysingii]|uniref:Uncharacterized protein n=1 Tax=Desulfuromusa kysingii TaxID=37625 RepID=A0A1H4AHV8_9BACT|nr:hypothetical protein [Desulfuromusa kysingii]SEA35341.1 hypothetical protein SAMN05660420_01840 [Desulfuromusa kysingii]